MKRKTTILPKSFTCPLNIMSKIYFWLLILIDSIPSCDIFYTLFWELPIFQHEKMIKGGCEQNELLSSWLWSKMCFCKSPFQCLCRAMTMGWHYCQDHPSQQSVDLLDPTTTITFSVFSAKHANSAISESLLLSRT